MTRIKMLLSPQIDRMIMGDTSHYTTRLNLARWPDAQATALTHHVLGGHLSYSRIADAINDEFKTSFSRNACIGKAGRLGLINPYWHKLVTTPKKPRKPQAYKPRPKRPMSVESHEYIELECSEIIPEHVDIVACNGCRWAYGDGAFTFCNRPQFEGSSYCLGHYRMSIRSGNYTESDRLRRSLQIRKFTKSHFAPETMEPIA